MWQLSDDVLIEAYQQAMELQLDERFLKMLLAEIRLRGLDRHSESHTA